MRKKGGTVSQAGLGEDAGCFEGGRKDGIFGVMKRVPCLHRENLSEPLVKLAGLSACEKTALIEPQVRGRWELGR